MTDRGGHDGEAYARRLAAVAAGHRGHAEAAERLLRDADAGVRAAALGALARCGALGADHVQQALGDEAASVRRRAAELAPPEVELVWLLRDADASVLEAAAAALGERDHDPGPVAELCRVARRHDDPLCRESAVAALGAIAACLLAAAGPTTGPERREAEHSTADDRGTEHGGTEHRGTGHSEAGAGSHDAALPLALKALLAAMDDRPQIRRRALLGLHQFDDRRAADAVRAALEDRDRQVRAVAGELLGVPVR